MAGLEWARRGGTTGHNFITQLVATADLAGVALIAFTGQDDLGRKIMTMNDTQPLTEVKAQAEVARGEVVSGQDLRSAPDQMTR